MVTSLRRRLDDQRGFTLIELLVVMIIISILMAVAVPVFLGQKQKAVASQTKQNVKHVADTIESCAASTTTGEIKVGTVDCTLPATVTTNEASLASIYQAGAGTGKVNLVSAAQDAYDIQGTTANATNQQVLFDYNRTASDVTKTCKQGGGGAQAMARMCGPGATPNW
jgi:type IV pilus assembly protein PilA